MACLRDTLAVIAWVRECVGGTVLIAAVKYVCVLGGEGGSVGVGVIVWVGGCDGVGGCGCDCVGEEVSVWVIQSQLLL